jgi:hypothetical protein
MSDRSKMTVRKWLFGAGAALVLSSFVGLAGLAAGANWTVFLVTFGTAAATHFGAWMKQHPIEDIE